MRAAAVLTVTGVACATTNLVPTARPHVLAARMPAPRLALSDISPAVELAVQARIAFIGTFLPLTTAAISTRGSTGLATIVRSMREEQPPRAINVGNSLVYASRIVYHLRMGYMLFAWNELILLLSQNVACIGLLHRFGGKRKRMALLALARDLGLLATATFGMARLPPTLLPILCLWTVPLALVSYAKQTMKVAAHGGVTSIPATTSVVMLRWLSSLVRVITTGLFLGGDRNVLANHLIGLAGCSVLLGQVQWYTGLGPSRLATRRALYSQFWVERKSNEQRAPATSNRFARLPDFQWPSIGPYGLDERPFEPPDASIGLDPELVTEAMLRKAFAAVDEDDDGVIATEDLVTAIEQAMEADGGACNVEMVRAMVRRGDVNEVRASPYFINGRH